MVVFFVGKVTLVVFEGCVNSVIRLSFIGFSQFLFCESELWVPGPNVKEVW